MSNHIREPIPAAEEPIDPAMDAKPASRCVFAGIGLLLGFVGLASTIMSYHYVEPRPQRTTGVEILGVKLTRQAKAPVPEPGILESIGPERLRWWGIVLGLGAVAGAGLAWFCREGFWPGMIPFCFGVAAIAWMHLLVIFAVLFFTGALFAFSGFAKE